MIRLEALGGYAEIDLDDMTETEIIEAVTALVAHCRVTAVNLDQAGDALMNVYQSIWCALSLSPADPEAIDISIMRKVSKREWWFVSLVLSQASACWREYWACCDAPTWFRPARRDDHAHG